MFYQATITKWESLRDSKGRVSAMDGSGGREFVINPKRLTEIKTKGTGSSFYFFDNHFDKRENGAYIEATDTVTELQEAYDDELQSKFITLPIYRSNNPNRATDNVQIEAEMFAYADAYNADNDKSWVVYIKDGFKRVQVLVDLSLNDIIYNTSGDMKFISEVSLTGGATEDDFTTTIASTREIYNVYIEDSSGNDITATVTIRVAASGGVWHVYIYSVDAIADIKIKILY